MLRKDRGFGKASGSASTTDNRGCFICGSFQHYSRDCPDRGFPQKGRGKYLSPAELESYLVPGKSKGKKGQHKSKDGMWMEDYSYDAYPLQKGKSGKGYGKPKGKPSTVNMYNMDYYGLEMMDDFRTGDFTMDCFPLELYATSDSVQQSVPTIPLGSGMLDCGATASAGPEASIKALLGHLRHQDPNILVSLNYDKCPFFRYGSGSWGQALYQVTITSSSNPSRLFMAYACPIPRTMDNPGFIRVCWFLFW